MANLLKPNTVKVITQDGELHVTISLELSINLNHENMKMLNSPSAVVPEVTVSKKIASEEDDKPDWEIPDFAPMPKVEFGKKKD